MDFELYGALTYGCRIHARVDIASLEKALEEVIDSGHQIVIVPDKDFHGKIIYEIKVSEKPGRDVPGMIYD